jgi:hypothetical protein
VRYKKLDGAAQCGVCAIATLVGIISSLSSDNVIQLDDNAITRILDQGNECGLLSVKEKFFSKRGNLLPAIRNV